MSNTASTLALTHLLEALLATAARMRREGEQLAFEQGLGELRENFLFSETPVGAGE